MVRSASQPDSAPPDSSPKAGGVNHINYGTEHSSKATGQTNERSHNLGSSVYKAPSDEGDELETNLFFGALGIYEAARRAEAAYGRALREGSSWRAEDVRKFYELGTLAEDAQDVADSVLPTLRFEDDRKTIRKRLNSLYSRVHNEIQSDLIDIGPYSTPRDRFTRISQWVRPLQRFFGDQIHWWSKSR